LTVTPGASPPTDFSNPHSAQAARRMIGLDAMRAVAATLVFAHHLAPVVVGPGTGRGLDVGVMIFFTLSGYVLYRPFLAGGAAIGSFVVRRVARIWPAYLVASVGVALLFEPRFLADPIGLATMASTPLGVIWTLKLELVFYGLRDHHIRALHRSPRAA
jgi:peptidoglycan/LPS O-acetylase OafA/YrhL